MSRHARPTRLSLVEIGETVLSMAESYSIKKKGEFFYDALLYGVLHERFPSVGRQLKLKKRPGQKRSQRIDFRVGGTNPTVIELAHGSRRAGLTPSRNRSELEKLCRHHKAQTRFLLLLDPTKLPPFRPTELKGLYRGWSPGPGRFARLPVTVIYVRTGHSFAFTWKAKAK